MNSATSLFCSISAISAASLPSAASPSAKASIMRGMPLICATRFRHARHLLLISRCVGY